MTILSLPGSPGFTETRFGLASNSQADLTSPITRTTQLLALPGARWTASYRLPAMSRAQAAAWQVFLLRLRGRAGFFYGFDPDARSPRGTAAGKTPGTLTIGEGAAAGSLPVGGAEADEVGVFKAGDYLAYEAGAGRQLHMVVVDADADGSGDMTLQVEPPMRLAPAAETPLLLSDAACVMRLTEDSVGWDASRISRFGIAFEAVEVIL